MNRAARLWTAYNLSMLFWMYLVWVPYWWSIFKYGCDKGLVCSVLYGTGANLQIVPPKTKCPPSLVCHIVNHIGYPSPYFAVCWCQESPLKQSLLLVLDSFLLLVKIDGQQFVIINNNNYIYTPQRPHNITFDCDLFIKAKNIQCWGFSF